MKFINKGKEPLKVVVSLVKPKAWTTVKPNQFIETEDKVLIKAYGRKGLVQTKAETVLEAVAGKPVEKANPKKEVKALESKAGSVKVETKVLVKPIIKKVKKM